MEPDLISSLNQIRREVELLRGIKREKDEQGNTSVNNSTEFFLGNERDVQLCFLILLAYMDVFKGDTPRDVSDITILLHKYVEDNSKLHDLWNQINKELHDSYPQWIELVYSYQLQTYQSEENEQLLLKWMNEEIFFSDGLMSEFTLYAKMLLDVIDKSCSTLDIDIDGNNILVIGDNCKFYKDIFTQRKVFTNVTLCPEGNYLYNCALLNSAFFPNRIKMNLLKRDEKDTTVFPFEDARFGVVFSFVEKEEDKDALDFKSIISLVEEEGYGVVFGQPQKKLIDKDIFSSYSFPFVADYISVTFANSINKMYLCKKEPDQDRVRSLQLMVDGPELNLQYNDMLDGLVGAIKNHSTSNIYQELTKEDYLYAPAGDVCLYKIFRNPDQMSFVFHKITDIISKKTNHQIPKGEILGGNIIERVSENPFNVKMSPKYYLEPDVYDADFSKEAGISLFKIGEKRNSTYLLDVSFPSERYYEIARDLAYGANGPIIEQTQMECRIMMASGLLWNGYRSFLRVNASEEHPVCYRYCIFCQDDYQAQCQSCLNEVDISKEYDEDFVIYQFSNCFNHNTEYILVAPTKEEQHAYYIKKKDEYRLMNLDLINEIREEERKKISVDLHYLKHDAAQYLSSINSAANLFMNQMKDHSLTLSEKISNGYTVEDALVNITKSVSHVTEFLKQMTFLTDVLPQKPMIISDLVTDFVNCCLKRDYYRIILSLDDNLKSVKCLLDERIHKVFANILSNAERHAFTNIRRKDYELKISAWKENETIIMHFANNGTPPDSSLTEEGYFTRGLYVGKTGHSGFGGSIIRDTIEAQGGIVHLLLNKDEHYPFILELKLPICHD